MNIVRWVPAIDVDVLEASFHISSFTPLSLIGKQNKLTVFKEGKVGPAVNNLCTAFPVTKLFFTCVQGWANWA